MWGKSALAMNYFDSIGTAQDYGGNGQTHDETDAPPGVFASGGESAGLHATTTPSLDALLTKDSRTVLDVVDKLRRSGLSGIIQLPQIVVSGDQSSGKSSVLEAITEIPFPRKENLCTRFATEITLRRAPTTSIVTKIIPDKVRPATEKKLLEAFKSSIVDINELPGLMEEATNLMGLGDDGSGSARAFSRDILSIEIAGPGRPHLTLIDLPGLIHSENKNQSKEDVALIRGLVDDYIKEKRTIIMAVVSAKNDYANQIILNKCRDVDRKGHRTIGVITKPDFLEPDSENEASWIELAENRNIDFELGWHMLKNRSDKEADRSFADRNAAEAAFFAQGSYRQVSPSILGIESLRSRLSQVLYRHLRTELPALQKELNEKHREVCIELDRLGEKRSTVREQRRFLMIVSTTYQDIVKAAVDGSYEHEFFGFMNPNLPVDHEANNMRRLWAVVDHLNTQFASTMRRYGPKLKVKDAHGKTTISVSDGETLDSGYDSFASAQETIKRMDDVQRVRRILVRSRGRGLPGSFDPLIISQLFRKQSDNWKAIADYHVERVAAVCSDLVTVAINSTVSSDVAVKLQSLKLDTALTEQLDGAKAELKKIIDDTKHHPITYNPAYTAAVQKMRYEKHSAKLTQVVKAAEVTALDDMHRHQTLLDPTTVKNGMDALLEPDMDKLSAEEALDSQEAYYKEEAEYFISAVTKQVVERNLLRNLASKTISPILVGEMTDEEISFVAAEPEETTRMRNNLETRKATLEKGQATFRSALGQFK
ncbi:hypothetical protein LTR08_003403 [Meristemomyces frigidus]|nr:hypothetical protein LTR08_003403 [Meristemomyces frigidus]